MESRSAAIKLVPVDRILIAPDRRQVNGVDSLAESIKQLGLLINPITIRPDFTLIAGGRRLAAVKLLGHTEIRCIVADLDDLKTELAQIDENLRRHELTALEASEQTARRKEIYEAVYPEAAVIALKGGRPRNPEMISGFSRDAALKTGKSQRSVRQEVQIATRIDEKAKQEIRNTPLADNKVELIKLARVEPSKQAAVVKRINSGEASNVAQAQRAVVRDEKRVELRTKAKVATAAAARGVARPALWQVLRGDCRMEMPKLEAGSVRLAFADPPYNQGIDYGDGAAADRLSDADFCLWSLEWMQAAVRLLTPDGSLWVLISDEYADHYGLLLRQAGLNRRAWIKWYETFGVNQAANFNRCSRHLFYCVKDPKHFVFNAEAVSRPSDRQTKYADPRANPDGKLWDNVWQIPRLVGTATERIPDFPTQLPLALLRPIIGCASDPGDLVLDPFNGSGTTGAATIEAGGGRRYVGIDKSATFVELAQLRLTGQLPNADSTATASSSIANRKSKMGNAPPEVPHAAK